MMAIKTSNCFHQEGGDSPCHISSNSFMILFGITDIFLGFDQIWWLSIVAAIMSCTYSINWEGYRWRISEAFKKFNLMNEINLINSLFRNKD
ncbi:hypothetical protein AQUCO_05400037v1 [Aquilegia coerulea]|uniref:Uncharacterized protein n=1 Tax=Aquilegia coerulea TaxID=218851 RepID=A0A2G5CHB4_AQUCA|nr:hypothetical protein AQUCO_05400037v1 [Aquilegia coerulea]